MFLSIAKGVLYLEAALNIAIFGPVTLIYPEYFIKSFLPDVEFTSVASHHMRFFGAAIATLAGILLWRALDEGGKTMKLVLEALVVTDIFYVGSFCYMVHEFKAYNESAIKNVILGIFLFLCRLILLTQYDFKLKSN